MRPTSRCMLVLLVAAWGTACSGSATDESLIALEADDLVLTFDIASHGGVQSVLDKQTGAEIRSDQSAPSTLFEFTCVLPSGRAVSYSNRDAEAMDYRLEERESQELLVLSFHNVGLQGLSVVCSVVTGTSHDTQWHIEITGDELFCLRDVSFPCLSGMSGIGGDSKDDWLVYPLEEGILIPDYQTAIRKWGGWSWTSQFAYPRDLSMQFMAQYDSSVGLYLAALDSSGTAKRFEFLGEPGDYRWQIVTQTSEEPRSTYRQSYPAVLRLFRGDWYSAATIYRDWASRQPWCSTPTIENQSLPEWFLSGEPVLRLDNYGEDPGHPLTQINSFEDVAEKALAFRRELNTALTVLLIGWEQHTEWDNPFSMPPRDGMPAFSSLLGELHDQGNRLGLVRSVTLWADTSPGFLEEGFGDAVLDADGSLLYDTLSLYERESKRYWMCPATAGWQTIVEDNAAFTASLGVDWLSLDEAPIRSPLACYATDHGHEVGSGTWGAEAAYSLFELVQSASKKTNPAILCPTETPSEFYIPVSDSYDARRALPDGHFWRGEMESFPGAKLPPVFEFVYHEYVVPYSEPSLYLDRGVANSTYIPVSQSLAVTSGEILGFGTQWSLALGGTRDWLRDTRECIATWQSCGKEFLAYGRMQKPPELDVPVEEVQPLDEGFRGSPLRYPAILASAWTSPMSAVGYIFSNISANQIAITPELDGFGILDEEPSIACIWRNGEPEGIESISLPQSLELILAAGEILLLRLSPEPSESPFSPPEVELAFNTSARAIEFGAALGNTGEASSSESMLVIESTQVDLPFGDVYRSIPSLDPGQSWQTSGQLTIPWDYAGNIELAIHCCRPAQTDESVWEWTRVWSEVRVLEIMPPESDCVGHACYSSDGCRAEFTTAASQTGIEPSTLPLDAFEDGNMVSQLCSEWVSYSWGSGGFSTPVRVEQDEYGGYLILDASLQGGCVGIACDLGESDLSGFDGIYIVLTSSARMNLGLNLLGMDDQWTIGEKDTYYSRNISASSEPVEIRLPFASFVVEPGKRNLCPGCPISINPSGLTRLGIEIGDGVGELHVHEVGFYRD